MSFLDTICCAFGAVILLFVLSKFGEPKAHEKTREELKGRVLALQEELEEIRGTTEVLNRELTERERSAHRRAAQDRAPARRPERAPRQVQVVAAGVRGQNKLEGQLVAAQQELTEEMKRLLGSQYRRPTQDAVGGIPVDSEYIIFIIDTSGSMFNYVWPTLLRKIEETLNIYPKVKGFQVMSDEGVYMFPRYRGKWLPDTPAQRKPVIDRLRDWNRVQQFEPRGGHRRGDPHVLFEGAARSASMCSATSSRAARSIRWSRRWT